MRPRQAGLLQRIWHSRYIYLYLLPAFALLLVFSYYPPLSAFYHAFFRWDGVHREFIGLDNFRAMLSDRVLLRSVGIMLALQAADIVKAIVPCFIVAELIYALRSRRWQYTYRLLLVIPVVIPGIVLTFIWTFLLHPRLGISALLTGLGLGHLAHDWLSEPATALGAVMFMGFPWVSALGMLIFLAALQNLPESTLEAAQLDGATGLRRIWSIDVPLLLPQIRLLFILAVIGGFQDFGIQLAVTKGGPLYRTWVPAYHLYKQAFDYHDKLGYASALGLVIFVCGLGFTFLTMRVLSTEYDS
jgi:multiple sugar transport system permease protein/raffinose/stachyose/melibiose transport system permease protein